MSKTKTEENVILCPPFLQTEEKENEYDDIGFTVTSTQKTSRCVICDETIEKGEDQLTLDWGDEAYKIRKNAHVNCLKNGSVIKNKIFKLGNHGWIEANFTYKMK